MNATTPTLAFALRAPFGAFLALGFLLFAIGIAGVLVRRNLVVVLMSLQLVFAAASLNFVAFARYWEVASATKPAAGHVFALVAVVLSAVEAVIGLAVAVAVFRTRGTVAVDELDRTRA